MFNFAFVLQRLRRSSIISGSGVIITPAFPQHGLIEARVFKSLCANTFTDLVFKIPEGAIPPPKEAHAMRMLGALVRPCAAEPISNRGFSLKKKDRLATGMHRGAAEEPPAINEYHTFGSNAPRDIQERMNRDKNGRWDKGNGRI